MNNGEYRECENKALPPNLDAKPEYEVRAGDVLMSRASGTPEFVGSTAFIGATRSKLMLSDKVFRIHLYETVSPHFFVAAMSSRPIRFQIENELSGGNGLANNLPQSVLVEFLMATPPSEEQVAIACFISAETQKLGKLSAITEHSITLLKERRSALITAAVTGQIDLREAA